MAIHSFVTSVLLGVARSKVVARFPTDSVPDCRQRNDTETARMKLVSEDRVYGGEVREDILRWAWQPDIGSQSGSG